MIIRSSGRSLPLSQKVDAGNNVTCKRPNYLNCSLQTVISGYLVAVYNRLANWVAHCATFRTDLQQGRTSYFRRVDYLEIWPESLVRGDVFRQ